MVFRTRVIVRRVTQNRMVTKGYRKGVYDRVTSGTTLDNGNHALLMEDGRPARQEANPSVNLLTEMFSGGK